MIRDVEKAKQIIGKSARLHYLDWLRVLAVLMVFMFHALHPFDIAEWHIKNADQSLVVTAFLAFFFPWGMPFFFALSGAGSWFALRRRTAGQFATERFRRLFIPLFLGALFITPTQRFFEWHHQVQNGIAAGPLTAFMFPAPPRFSPVLFGWAGYHLWFLGFLLSFSLLALPLFFWLKGEAGRRLVDKLARYTSKRGGLFLYLIPLVLIQLVLRPLFPQEHDWADFAFQMAFFVLGFVLFADQRFQQAIRRDGRLMLAGATLTTLAVLAILALGDPLTWLASPNMPQFYISWALVSVNGWLWVVAALALGQKHLDFDHPWQRFGRRVIMPFYVLHQPVIVIIAFFVVQMEAGILPKLAIVVVSAFLVSAGLSLLPGRIAKCPASIIRRSSAAQPELV